MGWPRWLLPLLAASVAVPLGDGAGATGSLWATGGSAHASPTVASTGFGTGAELGPRAVASQSGESPGWPWPVVGPVIRPFDPPESPYGSGHRGIDIAAPPGTPVVAPAPGAVSFAGQVGGHLYVSLDHGGGLVSTYSWLSALDVRKGEVVGPGAILARTGPGHPGAPIAHLHLGVKLDGEYVDPLAYLSPGTVAGIIRLAPLPA